MFMQNVIFEYENYNEYNSGLNKMGIQNKCDNFYLERDCFGIS